MASTCDDVLLDFDLNLLQHPSGETEVQNKIDKVRKSILLVKKKTIATDSLIKKYYRVRENFDQAEKDISAAKEEAKKIYISYNESLQNCSKLENEIQTLQNKNKELEEKYFTSSNQFEAAKSHSHQLQQLVKKLQSDLDALQIEKNILKSITKDENPPAALPRKKKTLLRHLRLATEIVFGKKKVNNSIKRILQKYIELNKDDISDHISGDDNSSQEDDNFDEVPISPFTNEDSPVLEITKVTKSSEVEDLRGVKSSSESINNSITKRENSSRDSDCNNDASSVDAGRGSSLAFSDGEKSVHSPDYFSNDSPLSSINVPNSEIRRLDVATSPIPRDEFVDRAISPIIFENKICDHKCDHPQANDRRNMCERASSPLDFNLPMIDQPPCSKQTTERAVSPIACNLLCNDILTINNQEDKTKETMERGVSPIIFSSLCNGVINNTNVCQDDSKETTDRAISPFNLVCNDTFYNVYLQQEKSKETVDRAVSPISCNDIINNEDVHPDNSKVTVDRALSPIAYNSQCNNRLNNKVVYKDTSVSTMERSISPIKWNNELCKDEHKKDSHLDNSVCKVDRALSPIILSHCVNVSTSPISEIITTTPNILINKIMDNNEIANSNQHSEKNIIANDTRNMSDTSNDLEVEEILKSMRFNHRLLTPIPKTPLKPCTLEATKISCTTQTEMTMETLQKLAECVERRKKNNSKFIHYAKQMLNQEYMQDKLFSTFFNIKHNPVSLFDYNYESHNEISLSDNEDIQNSNDSELDNTILFKEKKNKEKSPKSIDKNIKLRKNMEEDTQCLNKKIISNKAVPTKNNKSSPRHTDINLHQENNENLPEENSLLDISTNDNKNQDLITVCNIVSDEPNAENTHVKSKTKKLSKLDKLKKKMLPKSKIKSDETPLRKKCLEVKQLPIKKSVTESDNAASLNDKKVYEKALQVMSESKNLKNPRVLISPISKNDLRICQLQSKILNVTGETQSSAVDEDMSQPICKKSNVAEKRLHLDPIINSVNNKENRKRNKSYEHEIDAYIPVKRKRRSSDQTNNFSPSKKLSGHTEEDKPSKRLRSSASLHSKLDSSKCNMVNYDQHEESLKNNTISTKRILRSSTKTNSSSDADSSIQIQHRKRICSSSSQQSNPDSHKSPNIIINNKKSVLPQESIQDNNKHNAELETPNKRRLRSSVSEDENKSINIEEKSKYKTKLRCQTSQQSPGTVGNTKTVLENIVDKENDCNLETNMTCRKRIRNKVDLKLSSSKVDVNVNMKINENECEIRNVIENGERNKQSHDNKPLVSYGDISLFSDHDPGSENNPKPGRKSKYSSGSNNESNHCMNKSGNNTNFDGRQKQISPRDSIICTMVEKYGVHNIKCGSKKKLLESTTNTICKKIEEEISKIIDLPSNDAKIAMDKLVAEIQNWNVKHFVAGLLKYLKDPTRKAELFQIVFAPPAPPMTKQEQVLLYIINKIQVCWSTVNIVDKILCNIEFALFALNRTPDFEIIESMAHFYAVLCRYSNAKSRLRLFILDAMYCIQFKSIPLVKQCLDVWMHILPLAHMGIAKSPLVTCLVYLLHFYKCEDKFNRVQDIRNILKRKYFFEVSDWNETKILEMFKNCIKELKDIPIEKKMLRIALIILAKRNGTRWCQNNLIQKILLPTIEKENVPERVKEFCISMLGPLLKPYPNDMKVHCEVVINQLLYMMKSNLSPKMEEAVIGSLIYMSKHNQYQINKTLIGWKPEKISFEMEEILKDYVRSRPVKAWKNVLGKLHC